MKNAPWTKLEWILKNDKYFSLFLNVSPPTPTLSSPLMHDIPVFSTLVPHTMLNTTQVSTLTQTFLLRVSTSDIFSLTSENTPGTGLERTLWTPGTGLERTLWTPGTGPERWGRTHVRTAGRRGGRTHVGTAEEGAVDKNVGSPRWEILACPEDSRDTQKNCSWGIKEKSRNFFLPVNFPVHPSVPVQPLWL